MGARHQGRVIAFQTLYRFDFTHEPLGDLLDFSWLDKKRQQVYPEETYVFAKFIIAGTLENLNTIDMVIKKHLEHWDFSRLLKVDLANLRISVYGILYQQDIPASVTIDEAIYIAKEFGNDDSYRFINGVLDSIYKSLKNK
ncbi:MAG: transcription antitermination factor NusB [Spirochaetales bacterium]|nr:transcription antitermination factor NusB [Spirochaetales bacterium]